MAGYIVINFEVTDPEGFEQQAQEYLQLAGPSHKKYGGKPIIGGATCEALEGDWHPDRVAMGEFASVEQAMRWYNSEEYAPARALRSKTATFNTIAVQGLE